MLAMFQCAYCFCEVETVANGDLSPDLSKEVSEHIRTIHPQKWETVLPTDFWTRKIPLREVRPDILGDPDNAGN
jgi:hypothetical protein